MINDILLNSLSRFYEKDNNMKILNNILNVDNVSLRLIDWFTTNYSKKYNIIYHIFKKDDKMKTIKGDNNELLYQFNVYNSYKSQLKAYSKKKFDPFCRRERINFKCNNASITTTIGQLNFFKWVITNNIMEYITDNIDTIDNDMNISLKSIKKNHSKTSNNRKIRQELSKSALRGLNKNKFKVSLSFD
jgi:hypothetical protein